jgi:hypothetical protein
VKKKFFTSKEKAHNFSASERLATVIERLRRLDLRQWIALAESTHVPSKPLISSFMDTVRLEGRWAWGLLCKILAVCIVISGFFQFIHWSSFAPGQITECVKIESIRWEQGRKSYQHLVITFRSKEGLPITRAMGSGPRQNIESPRPTEAILLQPSCVSIWYQPNPSSLAWFEPTQLPFFEFAGLGQWMLLLWICCCAIYWLLPDE